MLKVADFKAKPTRSTESAVEKAWAATWKKLGVYSRHMSDHVPGLPDRYIAGGNWVEFKSLFRVRGGFTYGEGLSPEQIRCCHALHQAGDNVFYCAQLDGWQCGKKYVFLPWSKFWLKLGEPLQMNLFEEDIFDATIESREKLTRLYISKTTPVTF
jgi:hypothetical protein